MQIKRMTAMLIAILQMSLIVNEGTGLANGSENSSPRQARFRVTFNGFAVNQETWDHAFEVDGKRDEVYVRYDTRLVNDQSTTLVSSNDRTRVMGDTNGFNDRILAGSASSLGGLRTGDGFPTDTPWARTGGITPDRPPMTLFEGTLTESTTGVSITPTIWEWDGGTDIFNSWGQLLVDNGPAIARAVANIVSGPVPTTPKLGDFLKSSAESGLPPLFALASGIVGQAKDRPVGLAPVSGGYNFDSKSLVLTYATAQLVAQTDFGKGKGVVAIDFQDAANIGGGQYTAYLQVELIDSAPAISNLRPTPGAKTTDQTPSVHAIVRDAETDLKKSSLSLLVDGRKVKFSYKRETDRLSFTSTRRLSFGRHKVKVAAQDASHLRATTTWTFTIARR